MKLGGSSSTMSSYVAITRVERRNDLLRFRPFPRELFDKGQATGLELLLKVWRREHIDWAAIEKELTPQQLCHRCGILKYKECYWQAQWDKPHKRGNCKACVELRKEEGTPLDCSNCWEWKGEAAFAPHQRTAHSARSRVCLDCVETRMCKACKLHRQQSAFSQGEWERAAWQSAQGKCRDCMVKAEANMWPCKVCSLTFHKSEYSTWCAKHGQHKTTLVRCNRCEAIDEQQHKHEQAKTFAMVMKSAALRSTDTTTESQHAPEQKGHSAVPASPTSTDMRVPISCPTCLSAKYVEMKLFWQRNKTNRFDVVRCPTCPQARVRVNTWLRCVGADVETVADWLCRKECYNDATQPHHITVAVYNDTTAIPASSSCTSQSQKRTSSESISDICKKARHFK